MPIVKTSLKSKTSILEKLPPQRYRNQSISKIAKDMYYALNDENILEVYTAVGNNDEINAICIVDETHTALGVVVKKELASFLSRPYARDVMKNRKIAEVMTNAEMIHCDSNIFTVSELLSSRLKEPEIGYFLLIDDYKKYQGIFSTQDLLLYLSEITQKDIVLARKMQSRLVKETDFITGKTFEIATLSRSAKGVGGDFYSIHQYAEGRWVICVCDVSGKGIAASIVTSVMWGMMSIYDFSRGLRPFITTLNTYLFHSFESEKYVTGLFIDYNENTGKITLFDMGHSHCAMLRDNRFHKLIGKQKNIPVGVLPECNPIPVGFAAKRGDVLVILTDGILEQENQKGEKYSFKRTIQHIKQLNSEPVEEIRDFIEQDFKRFQGPQHLNDDATLAIMRFLEQDVVL